MATTYYLQSLHHTIRKHHNSSDIPSSSSLPSSLFLKPNSTTPTPSLMHKLSTTHFTLYTTTSSSSAATSSTPTLTFDILEQHLSSKDFRQADEETRRLLIALVGEAAVKRGYVFFSEVQFISEADLQAIDKLWRQYSDNKFGYSVQKRIYEKEKEDFSLFFQKVGWMKLLDTEVVQYNYKAFPNEFMWELKDDTPEGHLPLTNALRGTQLLKSILYHPAFESVAEEQTADGAKEVGVVEELRKSSKPFSNNLFNTDYSF